MTDTITTSKTCTCSCGHKHKVYETIEIKTLPRSISVYVVPNDNKQKTWNVVIYNHFVNDEMVHEATSMKDVHWFIKNVAFKMHRLNHRFSVEIAKSKFATATTINRLEFDDWFKDTTKERDTRLDWYQDVLDKASRKHVRLANKHERLGYKNTDAK